MPPSPGSCASSPTMRSHGSSPTASPWASYSSPSSPATSSPRPDAAEGGASHPHRLVPNRNLERSNVAVWSQTAVPQPPQAAIEAARDDGSEPPGALEPHPERPGGEEH